MTERLGHTSGERLNEASLEKARQEQREQIKENHERSVERTPEKSVESARHEALESAKSVERPQKKETLSPAEKRKETLANTKAGRKASYNRTMKQVQSEMPAPSRTFSKVIHNKTVEKASEAIGSTVARPNALLAGAIGTLVVTSAVYAWARFVGYPLSGFESIGAFIIGWLVGIIFDFTRIMVTGKR